MFLPISWTVLYCTLPLQFSEEKCQFQGDVTPGYTASLSTCIVSREPWHHNDVMRGGLIRVGLCRTSLKAQAHGTPLHTDIHRRTHTKTHTHTHTQRDTHTHRQRDTHTEHRCVYMCVCVFHSSSPPTTTCSRTLWQNEYFSKFKSCLITNTNAELI